MGETIALASLIKDPAIEVLCAQVEYLRAAVSEFCFAIDSRTSQDKIDKIAAWPNTKHVIIEWQDDFAWARNQALPIVTSDWVLHLDPDELPSYGMMQHLQYVADGKAKPSELAYLYWRRNWCDGERSPVYPWDYHIRMFRRGCGEWYRPVHEFVYINGMAEAYTRGTPIVPYIEDSRYIIHSKPGYDVPASRELYMKIEREKAHMMNMLGTKG